MPNSLECMEQMTKNSEQISIIVLWKDEKCGIVLV